MPGSPRAHHRLRLLSSDREGRYQSLEDVQFDIMPLLRELQQEYAAALLQQAGELLRNQQLDEANVVARKILELDPANPEGRRLREFIRSQMKLRATRPKVVALLKQAEEVLARRNYAGAIRIVDSARQLAPQESSIQARLSELQAARERAEQAAKLIEHAQKEFDLRNLTEAFRDLTSALSTDPGNADAQRFIAKVHQEMEAREREQLLGEGLSRAKGLLVMNAFDEASELLDRLAAEHPDSAEVRQLIGRLVVQKKEDEARQQLQAGIAACKERLKKGEFSDAIARLEELHREFPEERQIPDLLAYARDELLTREKNRECERIGREAWGFFKAQDFDGALGILDAGLRTYPGDQKLLGLMQRIASAKAEHAKALRLDQGVERCREMRRRGQIDDAIALAEALAEEHGAQPALVTLREELRRDFEQREREQAIARAVEQARGFLDQGLAGNATQLLQPLTASYPENPEIRSLLDRAIAAQKEAELKDAVARVAEREGARDWDAALNLVEQAIERHGAAPALVDAAGRILTQKNVAKIVWNIEQALVRRVWQAARASWIPQSGITGSSMTGDRSRRRSRRHRCRRKSKSPSPPENWTARASCWLAPVSP